MSSISKETTLSPSEVLTLKDISLKMVKDYNRTINSIKSITVTESKKIAVNGSELSYVEPEQEIRKVMLDRGYTLKVTGKSNEVKLQSLSNNTTGFEYIQWWGYRLYIAGPLMNSLIQSATSPFANIGTILTLIKTAPVVAVFCMATPANATICAGLAVYMIASVYWIITEWRACNRTGLFFNGAYWTGYLPLAKRIC